MADLSGLPTTGEQLRVFAHLFTEVTSSIATALYYAGLLSGMIVFPVYALLLLRRRVQAGMERLLDEISDWDPWLWAMVRQGSIFTDDRPLVWLEQLCRWRQRYRGVRVVLGLPDLEAKFLETAEALVAVLTARGREVDELSAAKRKRLILALTELRRTFPARSLDRLLQRLLAPASPAGRLARLRERASTVRSWTEFLCDSGLPGHLPPEAAAQHSALTEEALALALFLYAAQKATHAEPWARFLCAAHLRYGATLRALVLSVDLALDAKGTLTARVRDLFSVESVPEAIRRFPAWRRFSLAFTITPLAALGGVPGESFAVLRRRYLARIRSVHPDANRDFDTTEEAKKVILAWEVLTALHASKLLP